MVTKTKPKPRITKAEQIVRLARVKQLLKKRGFNVNDSGSGLIVNDLIQEFGVQRRTARIIEAKAARLLRGEVVTAWQPGAGRPPNVELSPWQKDQLAKLLAIDARRKES